MRRETQNVLLVLVGGALLKIALTGTYLLYVKPSHQYWLIAGGVVMLLLAAVSITRDLVSAARTPRDQPLPAHDHAGGGQPGHDHAGEHQHSARSAWLLLLPVLAIFLIAPPALGADSVKRADSGAAVARSATTDSALYPDLPPGDVLPLGMADFASRAAFDRSRALEGRTVRLTGFIVHDGDDAYLARLSIACCAADAFPVRVRLDGRSVDNLPNDTWVDAVGKLAPGSATKENDFIPTLSLLGVTPVPQPENPYEQ
ncbi:TIGR03943 family protein [Actinokineospora sp. PR83]|uniref:TIGR03943 family putative permease subunit n=1 Tax=Actinokineospora sp. PR83 TaxID=2884908 RepID=UPI001F21F4D7|nr:TIGR03943 family protein [Actinokineospora sp. PR83]MCG8916985.1 TIGR03943 family protein [Actinokineospora sp. PR83]